jgi:hypothetical protein
MFIFIEKIYHPRGNLMWIHVDPVLLLTLFLVLKYLIFCMTGKNYLWSENFNTYYGTY